MISTPHRQTATLLIEGAVTAGARRAKACAEVEISERTLRRWTKGGQVHADQRPLVQRRSRATSSATRYAPLGFVAESSLKTKDSLSAGFVIHTVDDPATALTCRFETGLSCDQLAVLQPCPCGAWRSHALAA